MGETVTHVDLQKEIVALRVEMETHLPYIRDGIERNSSKVSEALGSIGSLSNSLNELYSRVQSIEKDELHVRLNTIEKALERAAGVRIGIVFAISSVASAISLMGAYLVDFFATKT